MSADQPVRIRQVRFRAGLVAETVRRDRLRAFERLARCTRARNNDLDGIVVAFVVLTVPSAAAC